MGPYKPQNLVEEIAIIRDKKESFLFNFGQSHLKFVVVCIIKINMPAYIWNPVGLFSSQ